ncbi:hypothetical protein HN587_04385 [Candidatus Woesearchaeota archaeon]|jgi:hypothetical protein|nr:hypothetical protein [Candidatus Woesearchaeota archaeon]
MGVHFDRLVEIINKTEISKTESAAGINSVHEYLASLANRSALFDFPVDSRDLRPVLLGQGLEEFHVYLKDYLTLSAENGDFLVRPFKITALEDAQSVVILEPLGGKKYRFVECICDHIGSDQRGIDELDMDPLSKALALAQIPDDTVKIADIEIGELVEYGAVNINARLIHYSEWKNGIRRPSSFPAEEPIGNSVMSYIAQTVYIMDPENFIIGVESNDSLAIARKLARKSPKKKANGKVRKTAVRPHYRVLSTNDTADFLKSRTSTPRPIHPVRGYWKTLRSDKFVNMKGQRMHVKQFFRGVGSLQGRNGMNYQVYVKPDPVTVVPYVNGSN